MNTINQLDQTTSAESAETLNIIDHWIDNAYTEGVEPNIERADVTNPATGVTTGQVVMAGQATVDQAVASAKAAFPAWRDTSLSKRTQILFRYRELLNERKEELAALITAEHGKVLDDALGEVNRGLEVVEFACGMPNLLKGGYTENASTNVDVHSKRQPLGPVAIISPFNFPAMVPMWFFPVAIAAGNTVVIKPSEKDPSAVNWEAELWKEAGLPDGVFNVVHGGKPAVDALLEHDDIKAVSFVGSTPIAKYVYETATAHGKRVQALGGAKNHMLVLPDADLDMVADNAINAGFGSAGERCMAISALVAVGDIADELVEKIAERARNLRTGDGTRGTDMGPLVTSEHRDKVAGYIDAGEREGATVVVDGRDGDFDADGNGYFVGPTLFDHVTPEMTIYKEEIFGPVLSVLRVDTYEEGLELSNANPYGNGTAIFTNDGGAARRFENEVEVGMIGINVPIPVPMAYYSFGGWKNSLFGDTHAHGAEGVHFFTRGKAVTTRWSDPSHGGINLGFPQNQ
ncbi:CoA-acylating methylmalonate-semialdehyde dehydrogenase [Enteractinococcus helveticum]|uniref:CoA-acylating methylmalonate-semialdehyde dehydrogenase n=1 Tax=Enteractinococcus helveticum TaxID=1837282 RepID=UPI0009EEB5D6|nr:CoA-acylating methylmalonate-semialdehyde dehydrogenase [Enteractinococcus helveticum]